MSCVGENITNKTNLVDDLIPAFAKLKFDVSTLEHNKQLLQKLRMEIKQLIDTRSNTNWLQLSVDLEAKLFLLPKGLNLNQPLLCTQ